MLVSNNWQNCMKSVCKKVNGICDFLHTLFKQFLYSSNGDQARLSNSDEEMITFAK
jgi:hypothetical protein